ncbi:MAG: ECF transporter S component [Clostridiales bacterium]|nr:ECF transporter S component [Clostridiales bacterium]
MKTSRTRALTLTAILAAFIFLFGLTPLGLIPLGFINVTILAVPVIIGTLSLGLGHGLVLGFFFGLVSLMSVLGLSLTPPSALAGTLLAASPVLTVVMCFLPRLLVPLFTHLSYGLVARLSSRRLAIPAAAAVGSLTNTVFYLGLMYLFYQLAALDAARVVNLILGIAFIAGFSEAAVAAILSFPIMMALDKLQKR